MALWNKGYQSTKWVNSAARRRAHARFRAHLCRLLGCPVDSCFTTGELLRDARRDLCMLPKLDKFNSRP